MSLEKFFGLEKNNEYFQIAINPPSCGGGPECKCFALDGDKFLNITLMDYFKKFNITDSGLRSQKTQEFHNKFTLIQLGKFLSIQDYLIPSDPNHQIQDNDIKESLEALIQASRKENGDEFAGNCVIKLYKLASENKFLFDNWIGKFNEFYQQNFGNEKPPIIIKRVGGIDNLPLFQAEGNFKYNNQEYYAKSGEYNNKNKCKMEVASILFNQIYENGNKNEINLPNTGLNNINIPIETKVVLKSSIYDENLIFAREDHTLQSRGEIYITKGKGELLINWIKRKKRKNALNMLLLLSARLEDVSAAFWTTSLENGHLILLNLSLLGKTFFEVGFGESKTKAKKDAGVKMIENSKLIEWIEQNHPNEYA